MENDYQKSTETGEETMLPTSGNTEPAGSVAEVRDMLELNDKGNVKNTIGNCLTVFQYDPVLSHAVRYNLLTERVDVGKPLWWVKNSPALTDTDICYFMYYLEKNYGLTSEKNIQKAIRLTADCWTAN